MKFSSPTANFNVYVCAGGTYSIQGTQKGTGTYRMAVTRRHPLTSPAGVPYVSTERVRWSRRRLRRGRLRRRRRRRRLTSVYIGHQCQILRLLKGYSWVTSNIRVWVPYCSHINAHVSDRCTNYSDRQPCWGCVKRNRPKTK